MLDNIPDSIPRFLIKSREYWRESDAHKFNQLNLHPSIYRANIPYNFLAKVCSEYGTGKHTGVGSRRGIPACSYCGRVFPWFLHYCMLCGGVFIRDFGDPRFCDLYPTCWDCLPHLPWDTCPSHNSLYSGPRALTPYGPRGLNPRTFTDEELENVFDF